jgi:beta-glucosidase
MNPRLEQLVREVARVQPNTVVVLFAGGNVDMNGFIDEVGGLVHAFYPGQAGGQAVAEALFGRINPSGKLPASFEKHLEDRSSFDCYHDSDEDRRVSLSDGIFTGYRHFDRGGEPPRFEFGFGLSYTTFAYENLELSHASLGASDELSVAFDIVNTGHRVGATVAQLYLGARSATVPRPVKELKGFARVDLAAGERRRVELVLDRSALAHYSVETRAFRVEPGEFEVLVGASSRDIRLRARFVVAD